MALESEEACGPSTKLSHKEWKKQKRKQRRRVLAQQKREQTPCSEGTDDEEGRRRAVEEENERQNAEWERRDGRAHQHWLDMVLQKKLEKQRREEQEQKIREEWEETQRKEQEDTEKRDKAQSERRENQDCLLKRATENENKDWHNPLAPRNYNSGLTASNGEILRDVNRCPFFSKTAACRFGERCSRAHIRPDISKTIMIGGMFQSFELKKASTDDYDTDMNLEYEDSELISSFREFYADVLPEFKAVGRVTNLKVCCNQEPHLRGNVYVQYKRESDAEKAFVKFNARWYAGRQLTCEFVTIDKWKAAICGMFFAKRCPKGKNCNFMHVFRNPGNEFYEADRDFENSSRRDNRDRDQTPRWHPQSDRRSQQRRRSRSRTHESSRAYSHNRSTRNRSQSPASRSESRRRSRSRSREASSSSRKRQRSPTASRGHRSRSRSPTASRGHRSRSRSPPASRGHHRSRSRSPTASRAHHRSRSRSGDRSPHTHRDSKMSRKRNRRSRSRSGNRSRSRSGTRERGSEPRRRSRSLSTETERSGVVGGKKKRKRAKRGDSRSRSLSRESHLHDAGETEMKRKTSKRGGSSSRSRSVSEESESKISGEMEKKHKKSKHKKGKKSSKKKKKDKTQNCWKVSLDHLDDAGSEDESKKVSGMNNLDRDASDGAKGKDRTHNSSAAIGSVTPEHWQEDSSEDESERGSGINNLHPGASDSAEGKDKAHNSSSALGRVTPDHLEAEDSESKRSSEMNHAGRDVSKSVAEKNNPEVTSIDNGKDTGIDANKSNIDTRSVGRNFGDSVSEEASRTDTCVEPEKDTGSDAVKGIAGRSVGDSDSETTCSTHIFPMVHTLGDGGEKGYSGDERKGSAETNGDPCAFTMTRGSPATAAVCQENLSKGDTDR